MGTEAGEGYTTAVGSNQTEGAADEARKRADNAIEFCAHIEELALLVSGF